MKTDFRFLHEKLQSIDAGVQTKPDRSGTTVPDGFLSKYKLCGYKSCLFVFWVFCERKVEYLYIYIFFFLFPLLWRVWWVLFLNLLKGKGKNNNGICLTTPPFFFAVCYAFCPDARHHLNCVVPCKWTTEHSEPFSVQLAGWDWWREQQ